MGRVIYIDYEYFRIIILIMESFMGQLLIEDEIDYEAAKEHLEERIGGFVYNYVRNCCPKEYRQSDEWKNKDLSEKLSMALRYSNIDDFIDYLIDEEE